MEFFLGAFEKDWQRRRAALMHELRLGRGEELDWDWRRRGGVARLPDVARGGRRGSTSSRDRHGMGLRSGAGRSMHDRFSAIARGSQPAVVKLASYGGGGRVAFMVGYTGREGELAVENERGERVAGKAALTEVRGEWEHLFDNRADSRDVAVFNVTLARMSFDEPDLETVAREVLRTGLGDRRFIFAIDERTSDDAVARGVVVLRDRAGERLTGDSKAAEIVQQRFDDSELGNGVDVHFRFHGYGNGVRFATSRVRDLVERYDGKVRDETGRLVATPEDAGDLVQKDWRRDMHSRKGRDVAHLIMSARAGTDRQAFQNAVRDFLGEQFGGHRYVFAVHDPSDDPREMTEGGKRPHIHAHAIITMRSETGGRIVTSPKVFREWRALMAEKAREHGIDMELTDRRDQSSAPAYTRNQVRPVSYEGRTAHEGTSEAAQARYDAKRANRGTTAGTVRSRSYIAAATATWRSLAAEADDPAVASYAERQLARIQYISQNVQELAEIRHPTTDLSTNMVMLRTLAEIEEAAMQHMTRPEFEAYEKRVEAALESVERSIDQSERARFEEVAAAAREVVGIRREYLELSERQAGVEPFEATRNGRAEPARKADSVPVQVSEAGRFGITPDYGMVAAEQVARFGSDDAAVAHAVISRITAVSAELQTARDLGRETSQLERQETEALWTAGELAVSGNRMLQSEAERWPQLREAIQNSEAQQAIGAIGAARMSLDIARDRGLDTGPAEDELRKELWNAADLAQKGNDQIRAHADQDAELKALVVEADREAAASALDEIRHHRDNIRLVQDPGFAARRGYTVHDEDPSEHINIDHERQSLTNALDKAAHLGLEGNQFVLEAAERSRALKVTIERLRPDFEQRQELDKAQEALGAIHRARNALAVAEAGERPEGASDDLRTVLDRSLWNAADLAHHESNPYVREASAKDPDLAVRIEQLGQMDNSHKAGEKGLPLPDVAKGDVNLLDAYEHGLRKYEADIEIADARNPSFDGRTEQDVKRDWADFRLLEKALQRERENLSTTSRDERPHVTGDNEQTIAGARTSAAQHDLFDDAIARHGAAAVGRGEEILAELGEASDSRTYDNVLDRYAREALDGNTYLYEASKGQEHLQLAIDDEVRNREAQRYVDLRYPDKGAAVGRHGEEAVRAGDDILAKIDEAARNVRDVRSDEAPSGRQVGTSAGDGERGAERNAASLTEAETRHVELLQRAAREAVDGNTYVREMGKIRHDLNNEIHLESRRRAEAEHGGDESVQSVSPPSGRTAPESRPDEAGRADPPQQQVPRLRQIEQEIEERHEHDRDDRNR